MTPACTHVDSVQITELPDEVPGCAACLEMGDQWCHLRICLTCGNVGCCDSSPNRHATKHASESGHPIMRSIQPGEDWSWCFVDRIGLLLPEVQGEPRIPPSPLCP
jgi:uncharacterized UBP type Zn finger protein